MQTIAVMPAFLFPEPARKRFQQRSPHYFFTGEETSNMAELLARGHQHYIEMRDHTDITRTLDFIRYEQPHMSLSLTSHSAFRMPVAEYLTRYLAQRVGLSGESCDAVRTCLQEAVLNAIVHGNLRIAPQEKNLAVFQHYMEEISRRIEDEKFGYTRVNIYSWFTEHHLTLCVADQGPGFDMHALVCDPQSPHGRGMHMIRTLCERSWQTEPNHLYMQFIHG